VANVWVIIIIIIIIIIVSLSRQAYTHSLLLACPDIHIKLDLSEIACGESRMVATVL